MTEAVAIQQENGQQSGGVKLSEVVGKYYDEFWNSKHLYRVLKGAKGCKKSKTCALWYIYHMMKYPLANTLVIRKVFGTIQQSCYTDLLWAIDRLGVSQFWKASVSPLQLTYIPTGQVILFRGMDDAQKIASITVRKGILCWVWFEEAFEITNEEEFNKITMSIRGLIPKGSGLWKQFTLTFNPWSEHTWLKARFFDNPTKNVFAQTKTYKDNEFLGEDDLVRYEEMYVSNPRAARVYCDGEWGIAEGLIYTNWREEDFDWREIADKPEVKHAFGLDFGYAVSYNAFAAILVDVEGRKLWVYDEMYERGLTNIDIAKKITQMGYAKEEIWADSAEPKSIYELQNGFTEEIIDDAGRYQLAHWQLPAIRPALKGPDSLMNGIQRLQSFEIIVHPRCTNTIMELNNYCYDTDKDGNFTDKPIKDFDHCLVAGTMIKTNHGDIPIEDIKAGDMVLTHLGYQPVIASGITQFDQPIWRLETDEGDIIEGTWNHPIVTTNGVKYLKDVTSGDEVIKWGGQVDQTIVRQNIANMTGSYGIDIQSLKMLPIDVTSNTTLLDYIDMYGKSITDQSQKDIISTISTAIRETMTYQTLNSSSLKNMQVDTHSVKNGVNSAELTSQKIKTSAERGTLQMRDVSGTGNMSEIISGQSDITPVSVAGKDTTPKTMDIIAFAHPPARQSGVVTPDSITRCAFVSYVARNSQLTNIAGPRPVRVRAVQEAGRTENVYDLTVAMAHDFFANNLSTLNCMDAIRYASTKFFIKGRGHVYEAKGLEKQDQNQTPQKKRSRRVISSI